MTHHWLFSYKQLSVYIALNW